MMTIHSPMSKNELKANNNKLTGGKSEKGLLMEKDPLLTNK